MSLFSLYFQKDEVSSFFNQLNTFETKERIYMFDMYHTKEVLDRFSGIFPPPSIWEIWNRWVNLSAREQIVYKK